MRSQKLSLGITTTLLLMMFACAPKIIQDPVALNDALVRFNIAVQGKNFPLAMEYMVKEERDEVMDTEGEVKDEYLLGMRRLRLSTLKNKAIQVNSDGKLVGMLAVIKESSRYSQISKEQRTINTTLSSSSQRVLSSSSQRPMSSVITLGVLSSSSMVELEGFTKPKVAEIPVGEFSTPITSSSTISPAVVVDESEFAAPVSSSSSVPEPVVKESEFAAPVSSSSSVPVPVVKESEFAAPVSSSSVVPEPVVEESEFAAPVSSSSVVPEPVVKESEFAAPVSSSSAVPEPVVEESEFVAPVSSSSAVPEPVVEESEFIAPVSSSSAVPEPVVEESEFAAPVSSSSVALESVVEESEFEAPTVTPDPELKEP